MLAANEWWKTVEQPPIENLKRVSGTDFDVFVRAGRQIAKQIDQYLFECLGGGPLTVLDFGVGSGRVALPLHFEYGRLTHACDIDASAVAYVGRVLPDIDVRTTSFKPPLPYADNTFDAVYSISIWTHLTEADQLMWLREMRRVIKPGGYLLATTSSYAAIEHRQRLGVATWQGVDPLSLRKAGILYKESATLETHAAEYFPGVTDSYGQTSNDTAHLINNWSDVFTVKRHLVSAIGGVQDMNILLNAK